MCLNNFGSNIIRLFCLSGHYSKPIDYSEDLLKENLVKWRQAEICYYELIHAREESNEELKEDEDIESMIQKTCAEFDSAIEDDMNTHLAVSAFFQIVKETNRLAAEERLEIDDAKPIKIIFEKMLEILGLSIPKITEEEKQKIDKMISDREEFRKNKQFEQADKIRDKLNEMKVELIDHKKRTIWMRKEEIKAE